MADSSKFTGERFLPDIQGSIALEHWHRYLFAGAFVKDKRVLDAASGAGYGSRYMADSAKSVTAVDISAETIAIASRIYCRPNLTFLQGDVCSIPLPDNSFDVVVSFETIEHHDRHDQMTAEFKRLLVPDGLLVISSPDKKAYSDETGFRNPHHVKELYEAELTGLLLRRFRHCRVLHQRAGAGSFIMSIESRPAATVEDLRCHYSELSAQSAGSVRREQGFAALYDVCLCSDGELPANSHSVLLLDSYLYAIAKDVECRMQQSATWRLGSLIVAPLRRLRQLARAVTGQPRSKVADCDHFADM